MWNKKGILGSKRKKKVGISARERAAAFDKYEVKAGWRVRLGFPITVVERWFPALYPASSS
jgi:hypothetical protein